MLIGRRERDFLKSIFWRVGKIVTPKKFSTVGCSSHARERGLGFFRRLFFSRSRRYIVGTNFYCPGFSFFFRVKSVSLSRHEHAATNIKVTTIGSAHNNEFFLLLVREFPFPSLPFYLPKSAGDISVVNYEGKNVFDFFVPFSSKKKRLFLKKYFGMKEAP